MRGARADIRPRRHRQDDAGKQVPEPCVHRHRGRHRAHGRAPLHRRGGHLGRPAQVRGLCGRPSRGDRHAGDRHAGQGRSDVRGAAVQGREQGQHRGLRIRQGLRARRREVRGPSAQARQGEREGHTRGAGGPREAPEVRAAGRGRGLRPLDAQALQADRAAAQGMVRHDAVLQLQDAGGPRQQDQRRTAAGRQEGHVHHAPPVLGREEPLRAGGRAAAQL